jgi:prepilin-type N-terminal cleavage/methylation domain-containing protein
MTWPSESRLPRQARHGFTLIEALVAAAVLAILVGTALAGVSWTLGQSAARTDGAWLTELARSVIDEYRVTRDTALAEGRAEPDLVWTLSTDEPSDPAAGALLVEVTASAWREGQPDRPVTLQALLPEVAP